MSISLSDLNSVNLGVSKRRKRKAVVNLAQEYSAEEKEKSPIKIKEGVEALEVKKEELASDLLLNQDQLSTDSALVQHSLSTCTALVQERLFCSSPSRVDFLCQKKLPRAVLNFIINSSACSDIHIIHTDELRSEFEKSASHLSNIIGRLETQGYIAVVDFSTNGTRQIKVNPSIKI